MEVVLFILTVLVIAAAVLRVGLEVVHSLGIQRSERKPDIDALVQNWDKRQVQDWEAQFPRWRWYVLDKLPSDQWPNPTKYGPALQVQTKQVQLHQWGQPTRMLTVPDYAAGGIIGKVQDATGQVYYNRDTGAHLADICGCRLCLDKRAALATKKSPRGHALLYCNCGDCINLRRELLW